MAICADVTATEKWPNPKEVTMIIKDIQMQADPVRKAALIHCRFWHTAAWEKACAMRDNLIDIHDPEWPHGRFWDTVDEIYMTGDYD